MSEPSNFDVQVGNLRDLLTKVVPLCTDVAHIRDLAEQLAEQIEILPSGTYEQLARSERMAQIALSARNEEVIAMRRALGLELAAAHEAKEAAQKAERLANDRVVIDETVFDVNASGDIMGARTSRARYKLAPALPAR